MKHLYSNRIEAATLLAERLKQYAGQDGVVLAVPRGGVPLGCLVARALHMPLELLMTKKIGHPMNPEYAIGAVSLTDQMIVPHEDVGQDYIERETRWIRKKLQDNYRKFMGDHQPLPLKGKILIIIDDGMATGNTLLSTINMLRKEAPAKIVVAVPVAPASAVEKIRPLVDEIIVPLVPQNFYGVGGFYEDFQQISDEEVIQLLQDYFSHGLSNTKEN